MNKSKILKQVMNSMEPEMVALGFDKVLSQQMFVKDKNRDFKLICDLIAINDYNIVEDKNGVNIEPAVFVHNSVVESVYSRITTRQSENILDFYTIGNKLAVFVNNPSGIFDIRNKSLDLFVYNDEDIDAVTNALLQYFEDFGLPYFEKYATWEGLNGIFNNDLSYDTVHCTIEPERSLRGIIVAKLINRNDLDNLIRIQSERIRSIGIERFEVELTRLLDVIDEIDPLHMFQN